MKAPDAQADPIAQALPAGLAGRSFRMVVAGASAGGMQALLKVLGPLPVDFGLPVVVVQHLHGSDNGRLAVHLDSQLALRVVEAEDKQATGPGCVHLAPAGYHLLVERDGSLSLSVDPKINFSRPSIDVLFESAARAFGDELIGVVLSGANEDGAQGLVLIHELGGVCIAQDPATAESPPMPRAAIARAQIDLVLSPEEISALLARLGGMSAGGSATADPGEKAR